MLEMNLKSINQNCEKLAKVIQTYKDNYQEILHEIKNAEFSWKDDHSESFFNNISNQKAKYEEFIENLNEINNINKNSAISIDAIDNNIQQVKYNSDSKSKILNDYDSLIDKLNNTQKMLNSLPTWVCDSGEKAIVRNQKTNINKKMLNIKKSKEKVEKLMNELDTIETELPQKIAKISVAKISEFSDNEFR